MKRCWKKTIAFGLALSMLASCVVVSAEETETNASGITVIEDAVYDEAVSFLDTVVLLENGHWAKMIENETTGERTPYTDVTAETNIVFIDSEGNKKVISNKDANGEQIFDAVLPEITNLDSNDYICVFKGENRAYISPEGEFFGDTLKFYKDIKYDHEGYLWVTEDGVNYDLINKAGEVIYSVSGFVSGSVIGNCIYVECEDRIIVSSLNNAALIKEYPIDSSENGHYTLLGDEYVKIEVGDKISVLNKDGEEKLNYSGGEATYVNYIDYEKGYVEVIGYPENSSGKTDIVNIETGQSLGSFSGIPDVYSEGYVYNYHNDSFYKIEGNSISLIVDVWKLKDKMMTKEGISEGTPSVKYANGKLFVSISSQSAGKAVTYVYTEENNYNDSNPLKLEGSVHHADGERDRVLTQNYDRRLVGLYNFNMDKLADYTIYEGVNTYSDGEAIPGMSSILSRATFYDSNGYSYGAILLDGSLTKHYKSLAEKGNFLIGGSFESELEVLNGAGTVVYSGQGEYDPEGISFGYQSQLKKAYGLSDYNYFVVLRDSTCDVYDYYGNKVELGDSYSAIGPCETISGSYRISEETSYGYYCYSNEDLANGLCLTRKTDADGNHKYGVIKLPESAKSDTAVPTPEPTNTPVPTPEPDYEKGDIDASGSIDAKDALMVLKQAAKIGTLSEKQMVAADVDDSGNVNATDALYILKYAAKLIVRFVFDSEENIRVLRDYIKENGTVNENGNKQTIMDYVALGDSRGTVEYDSFEYDEENDWIIYVYERVADYPEDCLKFTITLKKTIATEVEIEWKDIVGNEVFDLSCKSVFRNEELSLDKDFSALLTTDYLNGLNDFTGRKQSIWQSEMKELFNSYVHSAFVSMEDYFGKTVIMGLPDIYKSYKYNDTKLEEILYPGYRVDKAIVNNFETLSAKLDENGIKVDGFAYFEEVVEYETTAGASYANAYVEKNTETNDVYFYLDAYHVELDIPVFVYIQPYADRNVFVDVVLYESNGEQYEAKKEVQSILSSMDMNPEGEYEYQCVYPENGSITADEKSIIDQDVNVLIYMLDEILGKNAGLSADSFGFIEF